MAKVTKAELSGEFQAAKQRAQVASARARAVHEARVKQAVEMAWKIHVSLPAMTEATVKSNARERMAQHASSGQIMLPISIDDILANAAVDMLMEACEPSMWKLDEMFATPGVRIARVVVRKRIMAQIAAEYPWLKQECARRFRHEAGNVEGGSPALPPCLLLRE